MLHGRARVITALSASAFRECQDLVGWYKGIVTGLSKSGLLEAVAHKTSMDVSIIGES